MTKTLTEQWREGTLPIGNYYIRVKEQGEEKIIDYKIDGSAFFYDQNVLLEIVEPVPSYDEYQGLLSDQLAKNEATEINAELEHKMERLQEQLNEANEVIKDYDYYEPVLTNEGKYLRYEPNSAKAYLEKWGVK